MSNDNSKSSLKSNFFWNKLSSAKNGLRSVVNYVTGNSIAIPSKIKDKLPEISKSSPQDMYNSLLKHDKKFTNELKNKIHNLDFKKLTSKDIEKWDPIIFCVLNEKSSTAIANILQKLHSDNKSLTIEQKKMLMPTVEKILMEKGNQEGKFDENVKMLIENLASDELQYFGEDFLTKIPHIVIINLAEQQINSFSQKQLDILFNHQNQDISSYVIKNVTIDKLQNSSCKIGFYGLCGKMDSEKVLKTKSSELEKLTPKNLKSLLKFIYESSNPKENNKFSDDQLGVQKDIIKTFILNPKSYGVSDDDLDYLVTYLNKNDIKEMFPVKNLQDNIEQYETVIKKFTSEQIHYFSKEQVEALLEKQKLSDLILKNLSQQQLKNLSSDTISKLIQEKKLPGNLKLDNSTIKSLLSQLGLLPINQEYGNEYDLNQTLDLSQEKIQAAKKLLDAVTGEQKNENWDQYKLTIDALEMLSKIKNNNIEGVTSALELLDKNKKNSIRLQLFANVLAKNITPEIAKSLSKDQISKLIELEKINDIPFASINNLNKDEIQKLSEQEIEKIIDLHNKNYYTSHLDRLIPKFSKNQIFILLKENIEHKFLNQDRLQKIDPQILFDKDIIKLIPESDITSLKATTNENTNNSNKENNLEHLIQNNPEIFTQDQINVLIASDNIKYFSPEFLIKLDDSEQIKKFDINSLTKPQLNKLLSSEKFQYLNKNVIQENNAIDDFLTTYIFPLDNLSEGQKKCLITSGKFLKLNPDNYKKLTQDESYKTIAQNYISNMTFEQAKKIFPKDTLKTLIDILAPNNQIRYLQNAIFEQLNCNGVMQINEYIADKNIKVNNSNVNNEENEFLTDDQFKVFFDKNLIINLKPDYVVSKLTADQIKQISRVYINIRDNFNSNLIFTIDNNYPKCGITIDQLISLSKTEKFKHINPDLFKLASTFDLNKMTYNDAPKEKLKQLNLEHAIAEQILALFSIQDFSPTKEQQEQATKKFNDINLENMSQHKIDLCISRDCFKLTDSQIKQLQDRIAKKINSMNTGNNSEQEVTNEDRFISKVLDKIGSQKAQEMLANINFGTLSIKRINFYISRESFTPTKQQIDQLITKINHVNSSQKEHDIQSSDKNDFVKTVLKKIAPNITQDQFSKINFNNLDSYQINDFFDDIIKNNNKNIIFDSNKILPLINIINRYQNDNINIAGRLSCNVLKKISNQITFKQLETISLNKLSTKELDALFEDCETASKDTNAAINFFSNIESKDDNKLINKLASSNNFMKFYLKNHLSNQSNELSLNNTNLSDIDSIIISMGNKPNFTKTKLFLRIFQNHLVNNVQETGSETQQSETQNEAYTKFINDLDDEAFQKFDFSTSENDIIKCLSVEKLLTLPDGISVSDQYLDKLQNAKIEIQKWASNLNFIFGIGGFIYMFFKSETLNKLDDKIQSWQNQKNQNINCGNQQQSQTTRNAVIPQHENEQSKNQNQQQAETKNSSSIFGKIKKAWHRAWENHEEQK